MSRPTPAPIDDPRLDVVAELLAEAIWAEATAARAGDGAFPCQNAPTPREGEATVKGDPHGTLMARGVTP